MAHEIRMPRLGWTMEEGVFGEWLKAEGEYVTAGDLLYTVEGDKAIQEVEALESGILRLAADAPQAGSVVPVGVVIAYLVGEEEALPFGGTGANVPAAEGAAQQAGAAVQGNAPAMQGSTVVVQANATAAADTRAEPPSSPRARRVAAEFDMDWRQLQGSGRTGRIVERDVRAAAQQQSLAAMQEKQPAAAVPAVRATPVAQRVAREAGIDLTTVSPAAAGERIQRSDVEAAIRSRQPADGPQPGGTNARRRRPPWSRSRASAS